MEPRLVAGRYRLVERLGQGGMGVVWRAHDELLERDVAIKELLHLRLPFGDDNADVPAQRAMREARAAARLRHPDVVAVHDVIVDDGRPLIVMELVEGRSLAQELRADGPLPEHRVAAVGLQILRALEAAHRQGIVHRDVKPANILLDGDRAVLTDFGIAAMVGAGTLTDTRAVLGSPEYLAPERVNGQPATPATDLWSLGVTLCAALRGESPFQRSDTQATLAAVVTYEPPPIPQAPRLWPLLAALLRKNPEERPTAEAAAATLAVLAGLADTAVTTPVALPVAEPAAPVARRRRGRRLAVLASVLVLLVAAAVWFVVRPSGEAANRAGLVPSSTTTSTSIPAPTGFKGYQENGFTIAVPDDWFRDSYDSEVMWSSDSNPEDSLQNHVIWWDERDGDAMDRLTEFEETEVTLLDIYSQYKRLRLVETAAPPGMTGAELEITYHVSLPEGELDVHELLHAVVTDKGKTYLLTLAAQQTDPAATEKLWQDNQAALTTALESFSVTG
jgi:hypothetical protein